MRAFSAFVLAAIVAFSAAGRAHGQEPQTSTDRREAEDQYKKGLEAYDLGHYEEAIIAWESSYRLSREPVLLFNLGNAARKKNDCAKALTYYQTYVRLLPEAENRAVVDKLIDDMATCAAAKSKLEPTAAPTSGPGRTAPQTESTPRRGRTKKIIGALVTGSGALLVGTGVLFGAAASAQSDSVTRACSLGCDWSTEASADSDGKRDEVLEWALIGVGTAAIVGGGIYYYLGWRDGSDQPRVAALPLRNGGGMVVSVWAW